jgi:tetrachlorobenzoquinone reductase
MPGCRVGLAQGPIVPPDTRDDPQFPLLLRLTAVTFGAEGIHLYELRAPDGAEMPAFTAGAHLDIGLPNGMVRQYSLCNPQAERHRYVIGVKRDPSSRGGSRFMHEELRVDTLLRTSLPRNNFPLAECAAHSVLIAGGIGVTPIRCMVDRLQRLGRFWELHYGVRRRAEAVFLDELRAASSNLHLHVDEEASGLLMDVAGIVAAAPEDAHLYCCGPAPMLKAFEAAAAVRPEGHVHVEYFSSDAPVSVEGGFSVCMAKSGRIVPVQPGQTILDALRTAGADVPFSCAQGVCGTCETRVLDGLPDHRDMILSPQEKAANQTMMICCSGSKTPMLVLDI